MGAIVSEDLSRPAVDTPSSRRIKTPEQLGYEIEQLDASNFVLSDAGKKHRAELAHELAEQSAVLAVNKQSILRGLETEAEIEETANLAITALEAYVEAREKLFELRRGYEVAWRQAQNAGIATAPRNRTAAPMSLSHRLAKVSRWGWYS